MKYTLFLFPYAGGSSYSLNSLIPLLEPYFNVRAIEYPGHGTCFEKDLVSDINKLTDLVFLDVQEDLHRPYIFWGHSMGALVCYLLTKKLQDMGYKVPEHLFLSGSRGPQFPITSSSHTLPYEAFWKVIQDLGGCPDEVLQSEELKELFEPILRSDFKCMETYRHIGGAHLNVPISLLLGREDTVSESEAKLWEAETSGPVELHMFEGNHFFIFEQSQSVVDLIIKKIGAC